MPLPTLYIKGLYEFPPGSDVNANDKKLLEMRPVDIACSILLDKLSKSGKENRVAILASGTGSGKSTVLPPELYKQILVDSNRAVLFAEPRINLCDNAGNDILNYYHEWSYGKEIAIHTGSKVIKSSEKAFIEFCTTQVIQNFLQQLLDTTQPDRLLNRYQIIVVDEAHILEIQTLTVIASIKRVLNKYGNDPKCPLFIFASATLNPEFVLSYFGLNGIDLKYILLTVRGVPNFPITEIIKTEDEIRQLNSIKDDMYKKLAKAIFNDIYPILYDSKSEVEIMDKNIQCRDVLVFTPGMRAITTVAETLMELIKDRPTFYVARDVQRAQLQKWRDENKGKKRVMIMGYSASYSALSLALLEFPFENDFDVLENETKIVVSSSVIETGKTIHTLLYSIDVGLDTKTIYNPLSWFPGKRVLIQVPANQSQRIQRRGRVGRKAAGFYWQFFSKEVYDMKNESDIPETVNSGCLSDLLYQTQLSGIREKHVVDMANLNDFTYPIPPDLMVKSLNDLFFSHLIGANGEWLAQNVEEQWEIYARLAYYILKMPLYLAVMLASINRYNLPTVYQIKNFNLETYKNIFIHTLENIAEEGYWKALDFIPSGRRLFLDILDNKNRTIIPYRGDYF